MAAVTVYKRELLTRVSYHSRQGEDEGKGFKEEGTIQLQPRKPIKSWMHQV
ncbi:hypothetical protein C5167_020638 [Papaver somniferum]|uniref:Uncharacterized protein n=1 Tax=Papaver somniferum TaxID=3469 RepID=A0A4Y7IXR9_PAPSO|nr:hypothetical protein C5167_020638 [Papaver somniferum]